MKIRPKSFAVLHFSVYESFLYHFPSLPLCTRSSMNMSLIRELMTAGFTGAYFFDQRTTPLVETTSKESSMFANATCSVLWFFFPVRFDYFCCCGLFRFYAGSFTWKLRIYLLDATCNPPSVAPEVGRYTEEGSLTLGISTENSPHDKSWRQYCTCQSSSPTTVTEFFWQLCVRALKLAAKYEK